MHGSVRSNPCAHSPGQERQPHLAISALPGCEVGWSCSGLPRPNRQGILSNVAVSTEPSTGPFTTCLRASGSFMNRPCSACEAFAPPHVTSPSSARPLPGGAEARSQDPLPRHAVTTVCTSSAFTHPHSRRCMTLPTITSSAPLPAPPHASRPPRHTSPPRRARPRPRARAGQQSCIRQVLSCHTQPIRSACIGCRGKGWDSLVTESLRTAGCWPDCTAMRAAPCIAASV